MSTTVTQAFDLFLRDFVRLDKTRSDVAKTSKNNLTTEIQKFPEDGMFLTLHPNDTFIDYGSFSRKTKIRPLDDIDLMVVLHAEGGSRNEYADYFEITVPPAAVKQLKLCHDGTTLLNSIKVINKFKEYLSKVALYEKAEIKRNMEAVTLKLKSYEWVYDIVPCFITHPLPNGTTFYLIPDGKGNWKGTDPRVDNKRTIAVDSGQTISVVDVIRLMKYWTKRPTMPTMKSYFLETMILNYYGPGLTSSASFDVEILNVLSYIYQKVQQDLNDPKGFQGNINHLTVEERTSIQEKTKTDYLIASAAKDFRVAGKMKEAIEKWRQIFGDEFPTYSTF
jgi:hypothetical protein